MTRNNLRKAWFDGCGESLVGYNYHVNSMRIGGSLMG